ncbi:MAG: ATP synthase F1 subunit gamma [Desulfovibrionaceae bacterium]|nr:ATP synthase F1 subunit gamma [Desulfovibrionaceae bacterium]
MSHARDIRRQIESIGKTRQITEAMRRIAYVKMVHARQRAESLRPYARALLRVVARLMRVERDYVPALMQVRPERRVGLIVVSTDRGLCGALNARLLALCQQQIDQWQSRQCEFSITAIGSRGAQALARAGHVPQAEATRIGDVPDLDVEALLGAISVPLHQFLAGEIDAIHVASNHFVNALTHQPALLRFAPFDPALAPGLPGAPPGGVAVDYLYEPDPHTVIDGVLLRYVETGILRAIIENVACEHCARMTAMQAASDNAGRLIDELTRRYHKTRQEAITRELAEITGGAQALQDQ